MEFDNLLDVCSMLPIGGGQKCFAEPEACLKMMGNGLFRHLLPGDEDTEGLEGMCVGIAGCKSEQALISLPRRRSSVGGKRLFEFYGCSPVGTKLRLGSSECILCSKCGVELHISHCILFLVGNGKGLASMWLCILLNGQRCSHAARRQHASRHQLLSKCDHSQL